jgi:hypothetical protein
MRKQPTWRIPVGILALVACLVLYTGLVVQAAAYIGTLPVLAQLPIYIVLGTIWLLPLRRFLIWMETGRLG